MADKQVKDYDKFNLRFPDGMRDAIAERAKLNGRSMNSEIVQILQESVYGNSEPDGELDALIGFIETNAPVHHEDLDEYLEAISAATLEITKRIERDNSKLRALYEAQIKNKKPT